MENNVNYTVVGAFVVGLFAVAILGIIWLSAGFSVQLQTTYQINMTESVTGLHIDAPVEYNGVDVGSVSSIKINSKNPNMVVILIQIKSGAPITVGTRAKLIVRMLTGISYILLEDKGANMAPLKEEDDQPYPIIKTTPSLFLRLDDAITLLSNNFQKMSTSIQLLLSKQNLQYLQNLLQVTESSMQAFDTQTLPAMNRAIANMDYLTTNLTDISAEIKENPSILLRGRTPQALGPGEK